MASLLRPVLWLFVLGIVVLAFPGMAERWRAPWSGIVTRNLVVQQVRDNGPAADAGIQPGDVILAVDGERLRNRGHYQHLVAQNQAYSPQVYTVARAGAEVQRTVTYTRSPAILTLERVVLLVLAAAFLAVGLWVYVRRSDELGTLFAVNTSMLAFFLTDRPSSGTPALQLAGEWMGDAVILLFPAALLHFFLRFPDRGARDNGRRRVLWLYLPPLMIFTASAWLAAARFRFASPGEGPVTAVLAASTAYFACYVIASLVVFVRTYRTSPRAQKQKLRVVIAGTVVGLGPFLATTLIASVNPGAHLFATIPAALCLGFVPATFGYAILKHGAIELTAVVRKSLAYALVTGLLIAGYYLVVQTLGAFLSQELGVSQSVWLPIAVLVLALAFAPARERVQNAVDRIFYRADYVYRQEVIDFNRKVGRTLTRDAILDHLIERCESLLHPEWICVQLRNGGPDLEPVRVRGELRHEPPAFDPGCFLGRYLTRFRGPLMVEFLDRSWERPNMDDPSRTLLGWHGLSLCVPIAAPDRLMGLILLGPRRSGVAYQRADGELLETFAEQVGLVIENADLFQSSIEQERLKSEVMLAREIQQALLPTTTPRFRGVEILGQTVSSSEVGGDYFDYFALDEDRVVVAIGDVIGKGIPAAMLMASLQAVFKNRAKSGLAPAELNGELNDYLIENAKPGQFATFFCGVFDTRASTFTFSSAGQCPALLSTNGYIDRLGTGGTVLGARAHHPYDEGTIAFRPGDTLLLYTDGITEQSNATGDMYGEERLIAFLRTSRNLPPADLQNALLAEILAFGNGAQSDDITSVIAYRKTA